VWHCEFEYVSNKFKYIGSAYPHIEEPGPNISAPAASSTDRCLSCFTAIEPSSRRRPQRRPRPAFVPPRHQPIFVDTVDSEYERASPVTNTSVRSATCPDRPSTAYDQLSSSRAVPAYADDLIHFDTTAFPTTDFGPPTRVIAWLNLTITDAPGIDAVHHLGPHLDN
jgi:hypothetical protein